MRIILRASAIVFCFAIAGFAHQGGAPSRRLTLNVVVTDHSGHPVPGLAQQDFTLLDDKRPQPLLSFQANEGKNPAAGSETQATVLIDGVNTPFQGVAFQREELLKFLQQNGGEIPVPMSLGVISETPSRLTAASQDGKVLAGDLNSNQFGLRAITRAQGFYGGAERVQISLDDLRRLASYEAAQPGRKMVIWLGPGWPLLSGPNVLLSRKDRDEIFHTAVSLSTELLQSRVTLYNISSVGPNGSLGRANYYGTFLKGLSSAGQAQSGNLGLQVFAIQSGGRVLNLSNDIASSIASCLADARVYYTLTFEAAVAKHPDEYHNLLVKIDKPKLIARTRTGYYAQP